MATTIKTSEFIKLMKIDLIMVLFSFGNIIQNVTVTQLIEDKMCLNQLNHDSDYCSSTMKSNNESETIQLIYKTADQFKNYQFIILYGPALILTIFLGYWLGNYPNYIKMMLILPLASTCLSTIILIINSYYFSIHFWFVLLSYVPLALTGGYALIFTAAYTYISWSTPSHLAIVRFAMIEFFVQAGVSMATYFGGYTLELDPWIEGQPKNYIGVFIISFISLFICLLIVCFIKLDHIPETEEDKKGATFITVIKDVFQLARLRQFASIFTKKRHHNGRLWLILLITSGSINIASILGEDGIAYQFAQRVYGLTADQYTSIFALVTILPSLMTSIAPSFFRSLCGLSDSTIAMIGSLSVFSFFFLRGLFLSIPGYIAGYLTGSFNRLSCTSARALVAAIVEPSECAQVFTLAIALETYGTLGITLLYTTVFDFTIDSFPGTIMILMACIQLYPLSVFSVAFIKRKSKHGDEE